MDSFYVYAMFRPDGTPCYVGKGRGWRHVKKTSRSRHLLSIMNANGGRLPTEKILEGLTESQAFDLEAVLIRLIGRETNGGPLVNQTDGGDGVSGMRHSAEVRERMRVRMTTLMADPAEKARRRAALETYLRDPTAADLRKSASAKSKTPEVVERLRIAMAKRMSDPAEKAKISAFHTGRKRPPETGAKIGAAQRIRLAARKAAVTAGHN